MELRIPPEVRSCLVVTAPADGAPERPWRLYWDLFRLLAWREFRSRYLGSALGWLWSVVTPGILLVVYTFVFRSVLGAHWGAAGQESAVAFAVNLFAGLTVFHLFADVAGKAPGLIAANPQFVKKVVFPLEVLPAAGVAAALGHALIGLAVAGAVGVVAVGPPGWHVLYLPLVLAPCLALALGAAWLLAAAGPFWRDLGPAVNVGLQLLLFATPIFYPLRAVPDRWRGLVGWNPLAICVENVRRVWLADRGPQWGRLALAAALAALLLAAGLTVFRKTKRAFADVV